MAASEGSADRARELFRDALNLATDHPIFMHRASAAVGLAQVALAKGDGGRAALLLGVHTTLRGLQIPSDPDVARVSTGARALIGGAAYEAAFARGAALAEDETRAVLLEDSPGGMGG